MYKAIALWKPLQSHTVAHCSQPKRVARRQELGLRQVSSFLQLEEGQQDLVVWHGHESKGVALDTAFPIEVEAFFTKMRLTTFFFATDPSHKMKVARTMVQRPRSR